MKTQTPEIPPVPEKKYYTILSRKALTTDLLHGRNSHVTWYYKYIPDMSRTVSN